MANTYVDYVGSDGTGTDGKEFAFSFPYIKTSHVVVEINQGPAGGTNKWERTTAFTVSTSPSTRVVLDSTPNSLWKIRVLRDSDANTGIVDFANGSVLTETELDNAYNHNRYLAEEAEEGVSGGTLSKNEDGQFDADALRIENVADPDSDDDAANKSYVDTAVATEAAARVSGDNDQVSKTGDTMSGALTLPSTAPTDANHATRKGYVDSQIATTLATGVAGGPIDTANIADDAVTSDKLAHTAVTPGSYTNTNLTVDQQGRITAASSGSAGSAGTVTSVDSGTGLTGGPITTSGTLSIANGGVDTTQLANGAVTHDKISTTDSVFKINTNDQVRIGGSLGDATLESISQVGITSNNQSVLTIESTDTDATNDNAIVVIQAPGYAALGLYDTNESLANGDGYYNINSLGGKFTIGSLASGGSAASLDMIIFERKTLSAVDYIVPQVPNLPTFSDNSAATSGGLANNDVYKTSTGELRLVTAASSGTAAVSKYSTGWFNNTTGLTNGSNYTFTHDLGTTDVTANVYVSSASAGTNPQSVLNGVQSGTANVYGAVITNITSTQITVQLGFAGYIDVSSGGGATQTSFAGNYIKVVVVG